MRKGSLTRLPKASKITQKRTMTTPHLRVTCAIIERDNRVFAAQRSAVMSQPHKWEFPGGKIHAGETPAACLRREILEELGIAIHVGQALAPYTHAYPTLTVTLYPFVCAMAAGEIILHEHAAAIWLAPTELPTLDWAAADLPVLATYLTGKMASGQLQA